MAMRERACGYRRLSDSLRWTTSYVVASAHYMTSSVTNSEEVPIDGDVQAEREKMSDVFNEPWMCGRLQVDRVTINCKTLTATTRALFSRKM